MYLYFILFFSVALLSINKNIKSIVILLTLFSGLRAVHVSRDTEAYYELFINTIDYDSVVENLYSGVKVEPWFRIASLAFNYVSLNFTIFLMVIAFIALSINFWQFKKYSLNFPVSALAYLSGNYLLHEMVQIRAGLAAAVYLIAVQYLNRCKWKYFALCLVASAVHMSFIVTLPIFFVVNDSPKRLKLLISLALILFFLNLINTSIFDFSINMDLIGWVRLISEDMYFKINSYVVDIDFGETERKIGLVNISRIIIATISVYLINKNNIKDSLIIKYFQLYIIGIIIYYFLFKYSGFNSRIMDIFIVVEPIIMSFLFYIAIKYNIFYNKSIHLSKIILLLTFTLYFLLVFSSNLQIFKPYETV